MQQQPMSKGRRRERGSVLRLILQLASRPEGVTTSDMVERLQIRSNAPVLPTTEARGHIFKAAREGCRMHWFATKDAAAAWEALGPVVAPPKQPKVKPPKAAKTATTPRPAAVKAAPVPRQAVPTAKQNISFTAGSSKVAERISGEAIITEKTIRAIDDKQRPTARWQMRQEAPDERWPSFASARPGVDPMTGKAWGA